MSQVVVSKMSKKSMKNLVRAAEKLGYKYVERGTNLSVTIPGWSYRPTADFSYSGAADAYSRDSMVDWDVTVDSDYMRGSRKVPYDALLTQHNCYVVEDMARDNYWDYEVTQVSSTEAQILLNIG